VFFDEAFNAENNTVSLEFNCPSCQAKITKKKSKRAFSQFYDEILGNTIQQAKQVPVLINYSYNDETFSKRLDDEDIKLIDKINNIKIPYWFPTERMPEGDESRRNDKMGFTHVHHYFTKRSLYTLSAVYNKLSTNKYAKELFLRYTFEQAILGFAKISRYVPSHFSQVNQYLSGTLYIGSQIVEVSLPYIISGKIKRLIKAFSVLSSNNTENTFVTTQSATDLLNISSDTIDYIFTDPPFGNNLMYSELNFLHESWNKIRTNNIQEAIINKTQKKDLVSS
jgi:adenine-specific DNA methylase